MRRATRVRQMAAGSTLIAGFIAEAFRYLRPNMERTMAANGFSQHLQVLGDCRPLPVRDEQEPR
jgi:hypothetical protein